MRGGDKEKRRKGRRKVGKSLKITEQFCVMTVCVCVFVYDRVAKKEDINTVLYEFEYE